MNSKKSGGSPKWIDLYIFHTLYFEVSMPEILDFEHITRKWASLRRFAGLAVESALSAIEQGYVDRVAPYFAKLIYFLQFAPRNFEKVLTYSFIKAIYGYAKKDTSYFEVSVNEIPGFDPDERDKVKSAFESMHDIGLAEIIAPDKIKLKTDLTSVAKIFEPLVSYVVGNITPQNIDLEAFSYPYRVISGVSSIYVMYRGERLPSSFTVMMGLISPIVHIEKDGTIIKKNTVEPDEWNKTRINMSKLRHFKDKFDVEYFKAIGVLYENKIIVRSYPIEVSGDMRDLVVAPAYHRYYTLLKQRRISRVGS